MSTEEQKQPESAYDILSRIPGAPTKEQIESWKSQTPNHRLRIFTNDQKRFYIVRGVSGLEMLKAQADIQASGVPDNKVEQELEVRLAVVATVWTNAGQDGKLTEAGLRQGSAGMPGTLFNLVTLLSDFVDPSAFDVLSAEL